VVGIDDQVARVARSGCRRAAQQEVAWKIDPFDSHSGAPRHLFVDQCQRNRNAGAPIEHFIEKAVSWIFVVLVVADEAEFRKQVVIERRDARIGCRVDVVRRISGPQRCVGDADGRFPPESIELLEIRAGVEPRIGDARNHQRRYRQVGFRAERDPPETLE
jgi:hypothetical protein